jgi:phosphatidylglycerophosphate synthase
VTLSAIPIGAIAGLAILQSPAAPMWLIVVPVAVVLRLVANLLDGALARRTGRTHARGAFLNELGDRTADVVMLAPVAVVPGAFASAVWLGVILGLLASFTSVATQAAGGTRSYRGILSKPGRMVLLAAFAILVLIAGPDIWWPFGPILVVGAALTLAERLVIAILELD